MNQHLRKRLRIASRVLIVVIAIAWIIRGCFTSPKVLIKESNVEANVRDTDKPPTVGSELPDSLKYEKGTTPHDSLINDCFVTLDTFIRKHPEDMLFKTNCEFAKTRAVQDYDVPSASPLMLMATLQTLDDRRIVLKYSALNTKRETDRLILVSNVPSGGLLRAIYHFDILCKDVSLVVQRIHLAREVSIDEIKSLGKTVQMKSGVEVNLDVGFGSLPILDVFPFAAAIGDRNGHISSFVPVVIVGTGSAADPKTD
jgi:hypothetical protein